MEIVEYFALDLEAKYKHLCASETDISDALPTLRKYASQCKHVTEFGIRNAVSTTALMSAQPKTLISYDLWLNIPNLQDLDRVKGRTSFFFHGGDTRLIDIDPTNLLFIDTLHRYRQLKTELARHSGKVSSFLIFHDTWGFRFKDEDAEGAEPSGKQGLWPAIEEFLEAEPWWVIEEEIKTGWGLTVLKRNPK